MNFIAHRKNTIAELLGTPTKFGVEVDVRSNGKDLILQHEPFEDGVSFEKWLDFYNHGTLILNVKEEGLEGSLINLMKERGINNYFFLDQSFPFLVKWSIQGERRCAVRVSEFESVDTALALAGKIEWVWVDCFSHLALQSVEASLLHQAGFKLCLVSPELHGRSPDREIPLMFSLLGKLNIKIDAICTKCPDAWEKFEWVS